MLKKALLNLQKISLAIKNYRASSVLRDIITYMMEHAKHKVDMFGAPYGLFVLFSITNLCFVPFIFSKTSGSQTAIFLVYLRVVANLLCFLLIMKDFWPKKALAYLPLFWFFTLFFCLPYFAMTTCLFTSCAIEWVIYLVLTIFILGVLADWKTYLWSLIFGALFSSLSFVLFGDVQLFNLDFFHFPVMIYATLVSLFVGAVFSRNRECILLEKLATFKALGGTIAHEMRTPLSSIHISASGLNDCLPALVKGYTLARDHGIDVPKISRLALESVNNCPERMRYICASTLNVIDMLLLQLKDEKWTAHFSDCSIKHCVETALGEYSFRENEVELVCASNVNDFIFHGNKSLVVHIIFNLMRNSFAFIQSEKKGEITIWTSQSTNDNKLHFRDTAKGIGSDQLPHIFKQGFSKRAGGSGVGLYYCKEMMHTMTGNIEADSIEGEFSEFVLSFPKKPSLSVSL